MSCSPSQGDCCGPDCNFKDNSTVCRQSIESDCKHEVTCSGKSPYCILNDKNLINCSQSSSLFIQEVIALIEN